MTEDFAYIGGGVVLVNKARLSAYPLYQPPHPPPTAAPTVRVAIPYGIANDPGAIRAYLRELGYEWLVSK